jgi:hypothetical protein
VKKLNAITRAKEQKITSKNARKVCGKFEFCLQKKQKQGRAKSCHLVGNSQW